MQDPAFAETCAWAVRASVDRGDHSGLLEGSMEDPCERDPEAPWEDLLRFEFPAQYLRS